MTERFLLPVGPQGMQNFEPLQTETSDSCLPQAQVDTAVGIHTMTVTNFFHTMSMPAVFPP